MLLNKYVTQKTAIAILKSLTLKVSDPKDFNDPFECKPGIKKFETNSQKKQYLNDPKVKEHYYQTSKRKRTIANKNEFKNSWKVRRPQILQTLDNVPLTVRKALDSIQIKNYFLVLCLSSEIHNPTEEILMWSHYTDGHKGAMLKIETDQIATPSYALKKIDYLKNRPSFHIADLIQDPQKVKEETERSLFVKNIAWQYENEYRVFFDKEQCIEGGGDHVIRINPEALHEVVIGCYAEQSFEESLTDLLGSSQFEHVKVKKAIIDPAYYRLRYE